MSLLILLLCSLPPLGVMAIAVVHAVATRNPAVLTMLTLSAGIISASVMLPLTRDIKPVQSVRFQAPDGNGVASADAAHDLVRLARGWETQARHQ
jgi:hypothetical protein